MILGTPGSGKSYSVYGPYIEQMVRKGYSLFVYDYKYPDLTKKVYNEVCANMGGYKVKPEFYTIDFDHPLYSHRCNPMAKRYINDPADSAEIADIIMLNVCPGKEQKNDFFDMSAKVYLDGDIYTLSQFEDGRFCTFAHLVELTTKDYKDVLRIQSHIPELEAKVAPFLNALTANAQDQLQGQIASATIPISRFASPDLYWVLSGDDFSMDINDPEHPKIICVGNNPDRQEIYGTTLALYVSRLCKTINKPGKLHSGVLLDELPTIFVKGLDNLVNTARSNKVAVVLNITTKGRLEGYMLTMYGKGTDSSLFGSIWGTSKIKRIRFSGCYSFNDMFGHSSTSRSEELRHEVLVDHMSITEGKIGGTSSKDHNMELSASYDVDDHSLLSAYARIFLRNNMHSSSR